MEKFFPRPLRVEGVGGGDDEVDELEAAGKVGLLSVMVVYELVFVAVYAAMKRTRQ